MSKETEETLRQEIDRLRMMVLDLTGPIAWYQVHGSDSWRVSEFTHDQIVGLHQRYRSLLNAEGNTK